MEFFKIIDVNTNEQEIHSKINLSTLNSFLSDMFVLEKTSDYSAHIGSNWGEFTLKYDKINGGVRFYLVECPNALTWTITTGYPPEENKVIVHLTINRKQKEQKFISELNDFIIDWETGIVKNFNSIIT